MNNENLIQNLRKIADSYDISDDFDGVLVAGLTSIQDVVCQIDFSRKDIVRISTILYPKSLCLFDSFDDVAQSILVSKIANIFRTGFNTVGQPHNTTITVSNVEKIKYVELNIDTDNGLVVDLPFNRKDLDAVADWGIIEVTAVVVQLLPTVLTLIEDAMQLNVEVTTFS